ncbi:MAG: hypothetical protein KKH70_20785 [Gammaproteobacteria bacterium]|nr:hypothetical protein [Gammaproteobacteria bacterium]
MDQEIRKLQHQKTGRSVIKGGIPSIKEMSEGIPIIRNIVGKGMYVFYKIGTQIYYSLLTKGTP